MRLGADGRTAIGDPVSRCNMAHDTPAPLLARRYRDTLRRGADGERRSGRREIAPG